MYRFCKLILNMFPACSLFAEVSVNSSLLAKKSEGQVAPVSPGSGIKSQLQDCSKVLDARLQLNEGHTKGNSGCGHSESLLQPPGAAVETLLFSENTVYIMTPLKMRGLQVAPKG
jgi:hypothetical protein